MRVARDGKQLSQERNAAAAFLALAQTAAATAATAAAAALLPSLPFSVLPGHTLSVPSHVVPSSLDIGNCH